MIVVVRRNDPCPCGSGKKYKKCHGREATGTHALAEEELKRVMSAYIRNTPLGQERNELSMTIKTWMSRLGGLMDTNAIEGAAFEHFLFDIRRDLWRNHLERAMEETSREEVKKVLESWQEPFIMMSELTGREDGHFILHDVFGGTRRAMKVSEGVDAPEGTVFFGTVLADPREREEAVQPVSTLYTIPKENASVTERILDFAIAQGEGADAEFLEGHLLEVFELLYKEQKLANIVGEQSSQSEAAAAIDTAETAEADGEPVAEQKTFGKAEPVSEEEPAIEEQPAEETEAPEEERLTDGQKSALEMLMAELDADQEPSETAGSLRKAAVQYFRDENPIVRKPGGIVAGIYIAAQNTDLLKSGEFTTKEAAKRFGVSEGTAQKYAGLFEGRL